MRLLKSLALVVLRISIAGLIIYWLLSRHYDDFSNALSNIDPYWLASAAVLFMISTLGATLRWYILLKVQNIRISYFEALSLTMQGYFFSLVIPGGALGGDLIKTGFLIARTDKGNRLAASSTIFMDRFLGMIGQFSIACIISVFSLSLLDHMADVMRLTVIILIFVCLCGLAAGMLVFFHRRVEKVRIFNWILFKTDKYSNGFCTRLMNILDGYNNSYRTLFYCISIGIIFVQLNTGLILYLIAMGIRAKVVSFKAIMLAVTLGNTAGLLPITPSGIGTRDVIIKGILSAGSFSEGDTIAIPLIFSAMLVLFSLSGGLFFLFSLSPVRKRTE